jgi:hypothetical protein
MLKRKTPNPQSFKPMQKPWLKAEKVQMYFFFKIFLTSNAFKITKKVYFLIASQKNHMIV